MLMLFLHTLSIMSYSQAVNAIHTNSIGFARVCVRARACVSVRVPVRCLF